MIGRGAEWKVSNCLKLCQMICLLQLLTVSNLVIDASFDLNDLMSKPDPNKE